MEGDRSDAPAAMSCYSCNIAFVENLNAFIDHMTDVHGDDEIQCTYCGDLSSSGAEYAMHFIYFHNGENGCGISASMNGHTSQTTSAIGECYQCPSCTFSTTAPETLAAHFENCHPETAAIEGASCSQMTQCPVCFEFIPSPSLNAHVNDHFDQDVKSDYQLALELDRKERENRTEAEAKELALLQREYGVDESGSYNQQGLQALNRAYGKGQMTLGQLYDAKLRLNMNQNADLLNKIREWSRRSADVLDVHLCTAVDHYSSSPADFGFGCGYRNIQMLLSSMRHYEMYKRALWGDGPVHMPSVPKLQEQIEKAWQQGFDEHGCAQLNGRLRNTRNWIGATEVAVFLQSYRIKVQMVDVHCPTGPKSTHPVMLRWCYDYFKEGNAKGAFVAPLYFQHQGHSRTIIGVERTRSGQFRLLIFDPSHSRQRMQQLTNSANNNDLKLIRKTAGELSKAKYQLVVVRGLIESDQQYDWYKTNFDFVKLPASSAT